MLFFVGFLFLYIASREVLVCVCVCELLCVNVIFKSASIAVLMLLSALVLPFRLTNSLINRDQLQKRKSLHTRQEQKHEVFHLRFNFFFRFEKKVICFSSFRWFFARFFALFPSCIKIIIIKLQTKSTLFSKAHKENRINSISSSFFDHNFPPAFQTP